MFLLLCAGEFIIGRVIRAMSQCWHPKCFKCVSCHTELADVGFVKNQGRLVNFFFLVMQELIVEAGITAVVLCPGDKA